MLHELSGVGVPASTPTAKNQHYINTSNGDIYFSKGTSSAADWVKMATGSTPVTSVFGRTGVVTAQTGDYTPAQVSADPAGTASTAVSTHEGLYDPHPQYALESSIGAANGLCPLGADSKVPAINLPSYVDDVLEFANFAAFPVTGEIGKIYLAIDTVFQYRWSGSAYVQIVSSPGTTDNVPEGILNLYFTDARARAQAILALLTGFTLGDAANVSAADTILQALQKLQTQLNQWTELITTADLTNSSNVTLTQATELNFAVTAGKKYRIELTLVFRSAAGGTGFGVTINTPDVAVGSIAGTVTMLNGGDGTTSAYSGAITTLGDTVISNTVASANTHYICKLDAMFTCTTSGNLAPFFRSETNGTLVTLRETSCNLIREF